MLEDLRWFGLVWDEGPDLGGQYGPYSQSERLSTYLETWRVLQRTGSIYPSPHSRKDVQAALTAPHDDGNEPLFPPALRPPLGTGNKLDDPGTMNWRFRVPDGRPIAFDDGRLGEIRRTAGVDFGDFLVWRKDGFPSYELAVVADDHAMRISEVVRGEDLLTSTARQILLFDALGWQAPDYYHCPLLRDDAGQRLAKRTSALALRELRSHGHTSAELLAAFDLVAP